MKPWTLRNKSRISYCESIEPPLDNYVYCDKCGDFVYEYCSIHGPLLVILDEKVPDDSELLAFIPRAALTIPRVFLHIAASYMPGAGLGVFSTLSLPTGVRFGPYRGDIKTDIHSNYCWQIYAKNNKPSHVVDAADLNRSNWMRYVNCARHYSEQNLIAFQYEGHLYYRTIKLIPRNTELLIFYGSEFANSLHIDLRQYNKLSGAWNLQYCVTPNSTKDGKTNQKTKVAEIENNYSYDNENYIDITFNNDAFSIASTNESDGEDDDINLANEDDAINTNNSANHNNLLNENNCTNDSNLPYEDNVANENNSGKDTNLANETLNNLMDVDIPSNSFTNTKTNMIMIGGLYNCMHCNFKRQYKKLVSKHILTNHKENCFTCNICNTTFIAQNNLQTHLNTHTTHIHKCNECDYITMNKRNFAKHLLIHKEKLYTCEICNFKTNYLKRHMQSHEKCYNCSKCDFQCKTKVNLIIHFRVHSNIELFKCDQCYYNSPSKKNLRSHFLRRHIKNSKSVSLGDINYQ